MNTTDGVPSVTSLRIDDVQPVEVGPGCMRRDLPAAGGLRVWAVDMAPGSRWPYVDRHDNGEVVFVASGEVIEGTTRYGAGTYLYFEPGTSHQPRTETGVRLIGFNP